MASIKYLVGKAVERYKEEGFIDTLHLSVGYVMRQIRERVKSDDYLEIKSVLGKESALTKKEGPVVHIIAAIPYYDIGGGQRCSQLAKTFNRMGYRVKYFYSHFSQDAKDRNIDIPAESHAVINEKSIRHIASQAKADDIFIFEAPATAFAPILDIAIEKGCRIVYENIDNWETSLGRRVLDEETLKKMLTHAKVLVGTAGPLVEQLKEYLARYDIPAEGKEILYLANAVDDELFCGARTWDKPEDLVQGTKTLLYYGSLWGEWFDWELIQGMAKNHPDYEITLIGNTDNIRRIVQESPTNIHFLGPKLQKELPAYLQYVDYAMIPFKRGEIGDYVSPLKIFEYISMYTKVLSTTLPDIQGYPNLYTGDTVEEWEAIVAEDPAVDKDGADAFINRNSWYYRVSQMQTALGEGGKSILNDKLSIVILNYNNKNVIFRCVNSLLQHRKNYGYEIIVVDNGSTDGSYEELQSKYANGEITLCRNSKNGCSSGRNLGVTYATKEYVMFLDSDQWVNDGNWLMAFERVMEKHPEFGAIGWAAGMFAPSGGSGPRLDRLPYRYLPPQMLCRSDIGYLGSGGMLLRRADFNAIDGFDVAYDPTCYEDTDISVKIRDYGKELYYCTYLGVILLPHQTTNAGSEAHKALTQEKRNYFLNKWKKKNPALLKYTE